MGALRKDSVIVPANLKRGEYVLGFRWDGSGGNQVWVSCASIKLVKSAAGRSDDNEDDDDDYSLYTAEDYEELEQAFESTRSDEDDEDDDDYDDYSLTLTKTMRSWNKPLSQPELMRMR